MVGKMLESALTKLGYKVLVARDAQTAILILNSHEGVIHLLLTDVVMPGMSGVQLADIVQKKVPDIKVMLMSGDAEEIVRRQDLIRPGYGFMKKPIIPSILAVRLRRIFEAV
jgi:two-component system cell cycle sensor histidine kinase/response regulator CckA